MTAVDELDDPVVVGFPLDGEWLVERTPAYRIPSHGTDALGQRFAYDLVRTDHRRGFHLHAAGTLRWYLIGGRTQDCYGWANRSMPRSAARSPGPWMACPSATGFMPCGSPVRR